MIALGCSPSPAGVVRRNEPPGPGPGAKISRVITERDPARSKLLLALLIIHMSASLWHHVHNGNYADEYPNLPASFPPAIAMVIWTVTTAVGLAGYYWVCTGRRLLGFAAMGIYAAYGLLAFSHYTLAPMSAHTAVANATIWGEGVTGLLLLITVSMFIARDRDT
jgi:hypothetical protein